MAYQMYIDKVLFPVVPAKLKLKISNQNKTITLINEGEVNLIKTPGLTDIEIDELLLPNVANYPFAEYAGEFKSADYYLGKLEAWKNQKKPVQFKMLRTPPSNKALLFITDKYVTIEDYEILEDAEKYGFDVAVKVCMKEYRNWGAKKLVIKNKSSGKKTASKKKTRKTTKSPAKFYIVKKGDCLYNIARKQLGDDSKWKSIYSLNKKTIEAEAKKHGRKSSSNGHWIYPGTKLKLPS